MRLCDHKFEMGTRGFWWEGIDTNNGKSKWCRAAEEKASVAREYQVEITTGFVSIARQRLWCSSCPRALRSRQWQGLHISWNIAMLKPATSRLPMSLSQTCRSIVLEESMAHCVANGSTVTRRVADSVGLCKLESGQWYRTCSTRFLHG